MTENPSGGRILVVEDDADLRAVLVAGLRREPGLEVAAAADAYRALAKLPTLQPDLLIADVRLPGLDGIELMRRVIGRPAAPGVILVTGHSSLRQAIGAIREGAVDYLTKPFRLAELVALIKRALQLRRCQRAAAAAAPAAPGGELIGDSMPMQQLYRSIETVAPTEATVLITGESGTGKELVARALHRLSRRSARRFVAVNCAALAETLLESELFGHTRGAFTGAVGRREGRLAQADGGTLFLDEIGELSPTVQAKLLRVLQERAFEPVGADTSVAVDFRLLVATHRDMVAAVRDGRFRADLFFRLNVVQLGVVPLRERGADVALLARHFLRHFAGRHGRAVEGWDDLALEALMRYSWPGNVRELRNAVEHAVVFAAGPKISLQHLPHYVHQSSDGGAVDAAVAAAGATLAQIEHQAMCRALERSGGSTKEAAKLLGISQRKIQYTLRREHPAPPEDPGD